MQDMERARVVSRIGAHAGGGATPPPAPTGEQERDLILFLAYHNTPQGRAQQALVTAASKGVADYVGGHLEGDGSKVSSVYHRIMRQIAPLPGRWLMKELFSDARLAELPGV